MEKTKVTLIYWGLSLFVFLALIPWIFDPVAAFYSIQILAIYGGIVVAFLGGIVWGWEGAAVRELQRPIRRMDRIVGHFRILSCMLCSTCLCYE